MSVYGILGYARIYDLCIIECIPQEGGSCGRCQLNMTPVVQ